VDPQRQAGLAPGAVAHSGGDAVLAVEVVGVLSLGQGCNCGPGSELDWPRFSELHFLLLLQKPFRHRYSRVIRAPAVGVCDRLLQTRGPSARPSPKSRTVRLFPMRGQSVSKRATQSHSRPDCCSRCAYAALGGRWSFATQCHYSKRPMQGHCYRVEYGVSWVAHAGPLCFLRQHP